VGRQEPGDPVQQRQEFGRARGPLGHGRAEPVQEKNGGGFQGFVGGFPVPKAFRIRPAKGGLQDSPQAAGFNAGPLLKIGEKLVGRGQDGGGGGWPDSQAGRGAGGIGHKGKAFRRAGSDERRALSLTRPARPALATLCLWGATRLSFQAPTLVLRDSRSFCLQGATRFA
jgi:hypothetical protein